MSPIALLILAAVAGFLFYNLRSVLGQTPYDGNEKPRNDKNPRNDSQTQRDQRFKPSYAEDNRLIELPADPMISLTASHRFLKGDKVEQEKLTTLLNDIQGRYPEFNLQEFIDGAKSAYVMIVEAFNEGRMRDVTDFISDDIYNDFDNLRKDYDQKEYEYMNVVTQIENIVISDVLYNDISAKITVEINSHNVISLKDNQGNILHGDDQNIQKIKDIWVFKRDFNAKTPAWTLVNK